MKKIFKTLAIVAVAALGFACQNDIDEQVNGNEGEKVTVEVVGSVADLTRSVFGAIDTENNKVPSTWSGNETVGFSVNGAALVSAENTAEAGATASFSVEFAAIEEGDTVYAVSPWNTGDWSLGGFSGINTEYQDFYVTIPATQTPLATSVEESAHLMVGEATYDGGAMTMTFEHVAAYGKMNITNFGGNGVKEIAVTFPTNVAGQGAYYYYAGEKVGTIANLQSNTVTINPENVSNVANGVWFTVAPVGTLEGAMTVVVTDDDDKTYTKELDTAGKLAFIKGQVSNFTVNMSGITEDVVEGSYNRITELSQLTDGCEAVIVAQNGDKYYALTSAGTSKPTQTEVTVNGETLDNASLKDALVMTVGVSNDSYTFKNGSSYLAYGGSGTDMKFAESGNTTFAVSVNGDYFNVKNTTSSRYVALYTAGSDWRAYTSLTQANSVPSLSFYVKGAKADTRLQSSLEFNESSVEVDLADFNDEFIAPGYTLTPSGGDLTWSSNNEKVATVAANGDVTIKGVGEAVITATFAGNVDYKGCEASYTINVVDSTGGKASFVKVTSAPADWSGTYLIVYESGNVAFNGGLTTLDAVSNTVSVTISNGEIEATDAMKAAAFTVVKDGSNYNIKSASGYYVGQTSNANGLASNKSTKYSNTLSVNNDASVNVVSGGAYLRYNSASNQNRFRYYKSSSYTGQKAIHFYKLVEE